MDKDTQDRSGEVDLEMSTGNVSPAKSQRQWAMGCHLIGLCGLLIPNLIMGLIGTLVCWLIKRDAGKFIDDQGRESVNFQITIIIYAVVCSLLIPFFGLGVLLLGALVIFAFVCVIVAAIKASDGISYRYPACIRLIK